MASQNCHVIGEETPPTHLRQLVRHRSLGFTGQSKLMLGSGVGLAQAGRAFKGLLPGFVGHSELLVDALLRLRQRRQLLLYGLLRLNGHIQLLLRPIVCLLQLVEHLRAGHGSRTQRSDLFRHGLRRRARLVHLLGRLAHVLIGVLREQPDLLQARGELRSLLAHDRVGNLQLLPCTLLPPLQFRHRLRAVKAPLLHRSHGGIIQQRLETATAAATGQAGLQSLNLQSIAAAQGLVAAPQRVEVTPMGHLALAALDGGGGVVPPCQLLQLRLVLPLHPIELAPHRVCELLLGVCHHVGLRVARRLCLHERELAVGARHVAHVPDPAYDHHADR
jgi:hypothetical protein